jgi:hypothetical protein
MKDLKPTWQLFAAVPSAMQQCPYVYLLVRSLMLSARPRRRRGARPVIRLRQQCERLAGDEAVRAPHRRLDVGRHSPAPAPSRIAPWSSLPVLSLLRDRSF